MEKYISHLIWTGSKGLLKVLLWEGVGDRTELLHIDPLLMAITAFLSYSPGLLNQGSGGPASLGHVPHSSIFSPTHLNFNCSIGGQRVPSAGCWFSLPHLISNWSNFLCTELYNNLTPTLLPASITILHAFNPSMVKVISWYSLTRCTSYLHRCISYFDSLARVGVQYTILTWSGYNTRSFLVAFNWFKFKY